MKNSEEGDGPTRGFGLLESFLSRKRAKLANRFVKPAHESGRVLDIGCGVNPYFLKTCRIAEKHGLDKNDVSSVYGCDVTVSNFDLNADEDLPYEDSFFDVVSMLAVLEHIDPKRAIKIFSGIFRVLKPGGVFVMTTPASWSDGLLKTLAWLRLVSSKEIDEHQYKYTLSIIRFMMINAGFGEDNIKSGYFELFFNMWAAAEKR
jgi:ubiquinone/menaquinone biosynthesis C-methylase UbiE